jgi:hypothetical protein
MIQASIHAKDIHFSRGLKLKGLGRYLVHSALILFVVSSGSEARTNPGRTTSELENPYSWEDREHPGTVTPNKTPPPPVIQPSAPTPDASRQNSFYERYFRKGKRGSGPDLPTLPTTPQPIPTHSLKVTPTLTGDRRTEEISALVHDLGAEPHRRQAAVERLSMIGPDAIPALQRALQDPYKFTRLGALEALGYIHSPETLPAILQCLNDPQDSVRAEAIKTLARLKHQSAAAAIAARLQDSQPRVRREAVLALGRLKGATAQNALLAAARDNFPEIRVLACEELSSFPSPETLQTLFAATTDPDRDTQLAAIRSLGEIGDPAARSRLQALSRDNNRMVRQAAQQALGNLE